MSKEEYLLIQKLRCCFLPEVRPLRVYSVRLTATEGNHSTPPKAMSSPGGNSFISHAAKRSAVTSHLGLVVDTFPPHPPIY